MFDGKRHRPATRRLISGKLRGIKRSPDTRTLQSIVHEASLKEQARIAMGHRTQRGGGHE